MIVETDLPERSSEHATETWLALYVAAAILGLACVAWVGAALSATALPTPLSAALQPPAPASECTQPGDYPTQVVYRYFERAGTAEATACWSPGRGPKSLAERQWWTSESTAVGFTVGSMYFGREHDAPVVVMEVRSTWQPAPPPYFAGSETKWIALSQQPDGRWTIDAVRTTASGQ